MSQNLGEMVIIPTCFGAFSARADLWGISLDTYIIFYQVVADGIVIVSGCRDLFSLFEESN